MEKALPATQSNCSSRRILARARNCPCHSSTRLQFQPWLPQWRQGSLSKPSSVTVHCYQPQLAKVTNDSVLCDGFTYERILIPLSRTPVPGGRFRRICERTNPIIPGTRLTYRFRTTGWFLDHRRPHAVRTIRYHPLHPLQLRASTGTIRVRPKRWTSTPCTSLNHLFCSCARPVRQSYNRHPYPVTRLAFDLTRTRVGFTKRSFAATTTYASQNPQPIQLYCEQYHFPSSVLFGQLSDHDQRKLDQVAAFGLVRLVDNWCRLW